MTEDASEESSSALAMIVGIAIGAACVIGILVGLFCLYRKKKKNRAQGTVDVKISKNAEMMSGSGKN